MSSFCFGQQASLQGKDAKNNPQAPQAGKSKSTKYKTLKETKTKLLAVSNSHWNTKQLLLVAFLVGIITVIIVVVVKRKNGTNGGNLMIIIIIVITVCIN